MTQTIQRRLLTEQLFINIIIIRVRRHFYLLTLALYRYYNQDKNHNPVKKRKGESVWKLQVKMKGMF